MKLIAFLIALALLPAPAGAQAVVPDTIKLLISPTIFADLPLMVAIDKGLFAQQNIDIKTVIFNGSSQLIMPEIARGDVDIAGISSNPGMFNQFAQGFDAKIIASMTSGHKGWDPTVWLMVRQDEWDAKTIRVPHDLRGKHFDGSTPGGSGWYVAMHVLTEGALTPADMTFSQRFSSPAEWLTSLRNINDVQAVWEPTVTQLERQHVAHRWISIIDIDPGYQEGELAASSALLKSRPDVVRRFLIAYVKASKLIVDGNGKWTPDLVSILAKWSGLAPADIAAIPTPPYTGELGTINVASLAEIQRFWHTRGLVPAEASIDTLVDTSFIAAAQKAAGVGTGRK